MDSYDPNAVIQAANEKLARGGDIEAASLVFQSALLEWSDDAREGGQNGVDVETLTEAIATLWIAYAQFYANHKQFKSATEAYEQAVADPVAQKTGRVWLEYARFLEERNKIKSAQDVYIRVLVEDSHMVDEQDQALLWNDFLEMMQKTKPELTLRELQVAVEKERPVSHDYSMEDETRPTKRPRADPAISSPIHSHAQENKTYVVTPELVTHEANAFADVLHQRTLPPEVAAGWMIRDGSGPAHRPEPSLFQASPPKLSDPTGKDILGVMLALTLIQRLLGPSGSVILNACEGLWTLQALKEQEAKAAMDMQDEAMLREYEQLEASLDARLAVAGPAASAVRQLNESERQAFQSTRIQQRQNIMTGNAWEFRQLLCLQQQVLSKFDVPGFEGPTVEAPSLELQAKICSYLHSAFFLRNRIGQGPHTAMLQKQVERLEEEMEHAGHSMSPMMQSQQGHLPQGGYGAYNGAAPHGMMQPQQMPFQQMPPQQMHMQYQQMPPQQQQQMYGYPQQGQQQPGPYGGVTHQYYQS